MANAGSASEEMLQCPICLEQYQVPRALPCLHTFCEKCLLDWVKHKSVMNTLTIGSQRCFPCPVCKDDVSVPPEGIKGFRHNFFVANALDQPVSHGKASGDSKKEGASSCVEEELDTSIACHRCEERGVSKICMKCNKWLCPLCCDDHKRVKGTKSHILASSSQLKDAQMNGEVNDESLSRCEEIGHMSQVCSNYCMLCKLMMCVQCYKEKHATHEVINVVFKVDDLTAKLKECVTRLKKRREGLQRQENSLQSAKRDILSHAKKTSQDFDVSYAAVLKKMNSMRHSLQKNLRKQTTSQVEKLDKKIELIFGKLSIEELIEQDIMALLHSSEKKEILIQTERLSEQAEGFLSEHLIDLDNMLTVSLPSWKQCEEDLFDQLITKSLGSCQINGVEVNLNKRVKKKAKRSITPTSKKKEDSAVDDHFRFGQLESGGNLTELGEIIRDFDPFGQQNDEGVSNPQQQQGQTPVHHPEKSTRQILQEFQSEWDEEAEEYLRGMTDDRTFDTIKQMLSCPGDDAVAEDTPGEESASNPEMASSPPVGPFYESNNDNLATEVISHAGDDAPISEAAHLFWSPPQSPPPPEHQEEFYPQMPHEFGRRGRGRFGLQPPPPPHGHHHPRHPPPHHTFGPPPHHGFRPPPHHRGHCYQPGGRGPRHKPGRRPPHHPF